MRIDGSLTPCAKSAFCYGNWRRTDLREIWNSEAAVAFRRNVAIGRFPDDHCRVCFKNRTMTRPQAVLGQPLIDWTKYIQKKTGFIPLAFKNIQRLFCKSNMDEEAKNILTEYFRATEELEIDSERHEPTYRILNYKLRILGEIIEDYLSYNRRPRHIAPVRRVFVTTLCNARCVHCMMNYTGAIRKGVYVKELGEYVGHASKEDISKALAYPRSIVDFSPSGSELLFYKQWEHIASTLYAQAVKLRIKTNGMLLTERTVRTLIDNRYLGPLNLSLDGATADIVENIRVGVKFDRVVHNIKFLVAYASQRDYSVALTLSLVLMKTNYRELPALVLLADKIRNESSLMVVNVNVQPLCLLGGRAYEQFVAREHHTLIDRQDLASVVDQTYQVSKQKNIPVLIFSKPIGEYIDQGCPLPPLRFPNRV